MAETTLLLIDAGNQLVLAPSELIGWNRADGVNSSSPAVAAAAANAVNATASSATLAMRTRRRRPAGPPTRLLNKMSPLPLLIEPTQARKALDPQTDATLPRVGLT
jgi:hypothetical protein